MSKLHMVGSECVVKAVDLKDGFVCQGQCLNL